MFGNSAFTFQVSPQGERPSESPIQSIYTNDALLSPGKNTTISAVAILEMIRPNFSVLEVAVRKQHEEDLQKGFSTRESLENAFHVLEEIRKQYPDGYFEETHPRVRVHYNPFAVCSLPLDVFKGPYDQQTWQDPETGETKAIGVEKRPSQGGYSRGRGCLGSDITIHRWNSMTNSRCRCRSTAAAQESAQLAQRPPRQGFVRWYTHASHAPDRGAPLPVAQAPLHTVTRYRHPPLRDNASGGLATHPGVLRRHPQTHLLRAFLARRDGAAGAALAKACGQHPRRLSTDSSPSFVLSLVIPVGLADGTGPLRNRQRPAPWAQAWVVVSK
jgi:hypothetical protein